MKNQESNVIITWIKKHPKWSWIIGLIILWYFAGHYPWFYMGDPIEGYVQDKMSGEPVAGAIAVLQFAVQKPKLHGTKDKVIYIAESVTDENGRYSFDKWGPLFNSFRYSPKSERVPTIAVFKQGYRTTGISNTDTGGKRFKIGFVASKNPILLEKFKNLQAELEAWKEYPSIMAWGVGYAMRCSWGKVPNFRIENDKRMRLYKNNLHADYHLYLQATIDKSTSWKDEGCSDPKIFFKEYLDNLPKGENVK